MPYLGNDLYVAKPSYRNIDDISGSFNGSTTSFPLTVSGSAPVPFPINSNQCLISVAGVVQRPDDTGSEGFRISGANIIFSSAPGTGVDFFGVILAGADYVNVGVNFPSGSAVAPSITFDSDLDTGIYNSSANQVSIATAGIERLRIDSAGQIESVSLGSAASPSFSFTTDSNTGIYSPGTDQVAVATNGTGRLFVTSAGLIGVGQSSPGSALDVNGEIRIYPSSGTGNLRFGSGGVEKGKVAVDASSNYTVETAGSERFRITSAGLVGVGTSSPSVRLQVTDSIAGGSDNTIATLHNFSDTGGDTRYAGLNFRIGSDNGTSAIRAFRTNTATNYETNLSFWTNPAGATQTPLRAMTIDSAQRVGVGSTTPQNPLVVSNGGANGFEISSATNSGTTSYLLSYNRSTSAYTDLRFDASAFRFEVSASEKARIDSSGRLGIGTSSPGAKLDVSGSGNLVRLGDGTNTFDVRFQGPNNWSTQLDTSADKFNIQRNSTSLVTVDSAGRLGIGTTAPSELLMVNGATPAALVRTSNAAGNAQIKFSADDTNYAGIGLENTALVMRCSNSSTPTERARIDSSGRLLVGTSSVTAVTDGNINPRFEVEGTDGSTGAIAIIRNSADANGAGLVIAKSRGAVAGSNTSVISADTIGEIRFEGADGTQKRIAASIGAAVDGTPGASDMPGRLVFSTTADGASSPTEAMRIDNQRNILAGGATDANVGSGVGIKILSSARMQLGVTDSTNGSIGYSMYSTGAAAYRFYVGFGGTIFATSTTISAISDRRLKENIKDLDAGLNAILALKPRKFDWKEGFGNTGKNVRGFIAQEVEEIFPDLIDEWEKGENHPEGEEPYKSVRQDLIPVLVKAIQEQQVMIAELQTEVAALKGA